MTIEREAKQITPSVLFLQEFPWREPPLTAHFSSVKNLDAAAWQRPAPSYAVTTSCAFAYQKSETRVMNVAYAVLAKHSIKPIARIHDAFVVRQKLTINLRSEIIEEMKDQMFNDHWYIRGTELTKYVFNLEKFWDKK